MKSRFLKPALWSILILALLFTGCINVGGSFNLTGTVTEGGSGVPLHGVKVTVGDKFTWTNADGKYELKNLPSTILGVVEGSLDGYQDYEGVLVGVTSQDHSFTLSTAAPALQIEELGIESEGVALVDGGETDGAKIAVDGNAALFGGVSITKVVIIINGVEYPIQVSNSTFDAEFPVDPGENRIQIRVWDGNGNARTSTVIQIFVRIPRLDIRVVMTWDTDDTDIDLHFLKRDRGEEHRFVHGDGDRHVAYYNMRPSDFGVGAEQNPWLDIDNTRGYGPETIVLKEATAGDYHIWVYPYALRRAELTKVKVRVTLGGGTAAVTTRDFELEFPNNQNKIGQYVKTIRVDSAGRLSFVDVPVSAAQAIAPAAMEK